MTLTKDQENSLKFCADETGVPYEALEQYVIKLLTKKQAKRDLELSKIKYLTDFTVEDCEKLRSEICLGSLYISDYENTFGLDPEMLSDIMDTYEEEELYDEDKDEFDFSKDTPENLYNFFQASDFEEEYLQSLVEDAVDEINAEYDEFVEYFWEEEGYYAAANQLLFDLYDKL